MSVPEWPPTLPQGVLQEGFSYGFGDGRLKTATDAGPGKMRRRFSAVGKPVSVQIVLDGNQLPTFETFYAEDLAGGVLPFFMTDHVHFGPLTDEAGVPLLTADGGSIEVASLAWLVKIDGAPVVVPWGALQWRASFTLMVMP